ncbi:MAG: monovalent cation/H+ antiporter subunit D family protein [Pseudohongiellaceae bacterium]
MINHLAILQVVVPLLAAPICLIFNQARSAWRFACLACAITFAISIGLLLEVHANGAIIYELGGWEAPWGIEYKIDYLSSFVLLLISGIGFLVGLGAYSSLTKELDEKRQPVFFVLYLLCLAGLLGIVATNDVFNVFVFLEISSLATYALVSMGKERQALVAAFQYLVVGTIGATFFLIGVGILYSITGTLNMDDLSRQLQYDQRQFLIATAFGFMVVGIGLKLAMFPLHSWLPNAYSYAPSIATAFLAASSTKVSLYLLVRLYHGVFGVEVMNSFLPLGQLLIVLGMAAALIASIQAMYQKQFKHLLAFSSVAQIGYMVTGVGIGTFLGIQAALLHLFNHALMKAALFLAVAGICYRLGSANLNDFRGLGRQMPWTMAGLVIGALSLIGVPLTVGFVSKWYLVLAAIEAGYWPIALLALIGSLLAFFYLWKIVELAYFNEAEIKPSGRQSEAPLSILFPMWILVIANIYFGIDTELTVGASQAAASMLMGAGQ